VLSNVEPIPTVDAAVLKEQQLMSNRLREVAGLPNGGI